MLDELKRVVLFASGVAELTRNRAEEIVRDWVTSGDVRRDQAQTLVKDLIEWSQQNRRELISFVSSEIQAQMATLGVATKRDVERLERRVARLEQQKAREQEKARPKAPSKKKVTTKKTSARAATASGPAPEQPAGPPPGGRGSPFVDPTDNP